MKKLDKKQVDIKKCQKDWKYWYPKMPGPKPGTHICAGGEWGKLLLKDFKRDALP